MDNNLINNFLITDKDVENIQVFCILSEGNPGACNVLMTLVKNIEHKKLKEFFIKIWELQIVGPRLWYIYKNECNKNINELIEKDLTEFNKTYFHEKFYKYI